MPHFTLSFTSEGDELDVRFGLNGRETAKRFAAGLPPVPPVLVRGVIDTGSDVTCAAPRVMGQLGLSPIVQTTTQTTAGSAQVNLFEMSLSLPRPGTNTSLLVIDQLLVMELAQATSSIEALVGRDVLAHLLFIHDGPRGEFTLAD
jgi:hypothetical protein